jgi:hypothetical protein
MFPFLLDSKRFFSKATTTCRCQKPTYAIQREKEYIIPSSDFFKKLEVMASGPSLTIGNLSLQEFIRLKKKKRKEKTVQSNINK